MKNKLIKTIGASAILGMSLIPNARAQNESGQVLDFIGHLLEGIGNAEGKDINNLSRTGRILQNLGGHDHYYEHRLDCEPHLYDGYGRSIQRASGNFNDIKVEYNFIENGEKGILIHTNFEINHNVGWDSELVAYFYNQDGRSLEDKDGYYTTNNGKVAVGGTITPEYDHSSYLDYGLFIPESQLDITQRGRYNLKLKLELLDFSEGEKRILDE